MFYEAASRVVEALGLQVWSSPLTEKPLLEPCFAAAFHGIELCFLLLAEFVADKRKVGESVTQASGLAAALSGSAQFRISQL